MKKITEIKIFSSLYAVLILAKYGYSKYVAVNTYQNNDIFFLVLLASLLVLFFVYIENWLFMKLMAFLMILSGIWSVAIVFLFVNNQAMFKVATISLGIFFFCAGIRSLLILKSLRQMVS